MSKKGDPPISAGRTFADRDRPLRWYVVLCVDFVWSLVWWEDGRARTIALSHMARKKIRITSFNFPVSQLLARWGITSKILDAYLEKHVYSWNTEVAKVRATRQPLTGRTTSIVRQRHRPPRVGGP